MEQKKIDINFGERMTALSEQESIDLLHKYDQLIKRESLKYSNIEGIDPEDLCQECRIRILSGIHEFDPNKSSEITWITTVVKRTIFTIIKKAFTSKRIATVKLENGNPKPLFNVSIDSDKNNPQNKWKKFEETYDRRKYVEPSFSSDYFLPEEALNVKKILEVLQSKLSPEIFEYIESKLNPDSPISEIIKIQNKHNKELQEEGFNRMHTPKPFKIFKRILNISIVPKAESNILAEIAEVFVNELGFKPSDLLNREKTYDIDYVTL